MNQEDEELKKELRETEWGKLLVRYGFEPYYTESSARTVAEKVSEDRSGLLKRLRELVGIQGSNGNWNHSSYMHGMFNGMELMLATIEEREPQYKQAPDKWLSNNESYICKFCGSPSLIPPEEQCMPPDYCHESDHGKETE